MPIVAIEMDNIPSLRMLFSAVRVKRAHMSETRALSVHENCARDFEPATTPDDG